MNVRAFGVHVEDPIVGAIVDHAGARPPLTPPFARIARSGTRLRFAERALVGLLTEPIGVADGPILAARFGRTPIRRQIVEARAEVRIDVFFQHVRAGVDVRIGVIDAEACLHDVTS